MIVLIDTNVIIDFLITRIPFYEPAATIMEKCATGELEGCVAFHTIPNLWYILRKIPDRQRRGLIENICDCLQDRCAEEAKADYIVTRNVDDFAESTIPAIEPSELIKKLNSL